MKKNKPFGELFYRSLKKTLLTMRIAVILMIIGILQARANDAYAQKTRLSINFSETELVKVLDKIETESEFFFMYNEKLLDIERKVSIDAKDQLISVILDNLFTGTDVKYTIIDRKIILAPEYLTSEPQQNRITGTVIDKDGAPIIGANVVVTGTTLGAITDIAGKYSIEVPPGSKSLTFSFIGMESQEINIGTLTQINVTFRESAIGLDEVVVVGYGTQKKSDLTGAIAVVDVKSMKELSVASVTEALQGKAAGISIINDGSPGSTPQIRIRGYSTINNNDPLYVIDGVPYQGSISWLNQTDIQSIQVLKDASSASIYGSRANNGVVIITTKKGTEGAPKITFDSYFGSSSPIRSTFPHFLTPMQYADYLWQSYENVGLNPGASLGGMYGTGAQPVLPTYLIAGNATGVNVTEADADPSKYNNNPAAFYQITKANQEGTDWMRAITRTAPVQNYQLGASGGGKNSIYALSLGYLDQQGIVDYTSYKRYNIRSNTQFSAFNNHLRIGENILFSRTEGIGFATNVNTPGSYQTTYGAIGDVYMIQPIIPVYDIGGNFAGARGPTLGAAKNPLAFLYRAKDNYTHENRTFGNLFAEVDILKGLTARTSLGLNLNNYNSQNIRYPQMEDAVSISTNGYDATEGYGIQWTWSNTINYTHTFNGEHTITLLAGSEANHISYRNLTGSRDSYFLLGDPNYYYLNSGTGNIQNAESGELTTLSSLFGRADYSLKNKYLFNLTIRKDGSSNFGELNKYGVFPSLSAGWRISNEQFMKNIAWIKELKIRAGYGETGNQNIPSNNNVDLYSPLISTGSYPMNGTNALVPGVSQSQIGNQSLKWEKLESANLGLDFILLNGALDGSVDVYKRITSGMLFSVPLPDQTGGMANSPFRNVGSMQNEGIEIILNYHYGRSVDSPFKFDIGLNFADNTNKILELSPEITNTFYGTSQLTTTVLKKGYPYGEFFGYIQSGIFQNDQEVASSTQPGARVGGIKYADTNGDGVFSSDDRTTLGSPLPDFTYGINLNISYKKCNSPLMIFPGKM